MSNEILPQKREYEKVSPHHELEIVPLPRRKLKQQTRNENRERGQEKGDCLRRLLVPFEAAFPGTPAAERDQEKCKWNKDAKIIGPELKETRTRECRISHDPSQMRFQDIRPGAEMIGGQPREKKTRTQRAGHNLQGMHACVAKQLVRNRASDAANSFLAEKINNELQWLKTFKDEKKKENDAESDKRVNVEERHRGIERELDPKGQRSGTAGSGS